MTPLKFLTIAAAYLLNPLEFLLVAGAYIALTYWLLSLFMFFGSEIRSRIIDTPGYLVSSNFLYHLLFFPMVLITIMLLCIVLILFLILDPPYMPKISDMFGTVPKAYESVVIFTDHIIGYLVFSGIVLIIPFWFAEFVTKKAKKVGIKDSWFLLLVSIVYYASYILIVPYLMSWLFQKQVTIRLHDIFSSEIKEIYGLFFNPFVSPIRLSNFWRNAVYLTRLQTNYIPNVASYIPNVVNYIPNVVNYIANVIDAIIFIGAFAEGLHVIFKVVGKIRARFNV